MRTNKEFTSARYNFFCRQALEGCLQEFMLSIDAERYALTKSFCMSLFAFIAHGAIGTMFNVSGSAANIRKILYKEIQTILEHYKDALRGVNMREFYWPELRNYLSANDQCSNGLYQSVLSCIPLAVIDDAERFMEQGFRIIYQQFTDSMMSREYIFEDLFLANPDALLFTVSVKVKPCH